MAKMAFPSIVRGNRAIVLFLAVSLILGLTHAGAWPRGHYYDGEVVERAEFIVVAHVEEGSITRVLHPIRNGAQSWEHHATLVITRILKGHGQELSVPIVIRYGLDPIICDLHGDVPRASFSDPDSKKFLDAGSTVRIEDAGGRGGFISGDIRQDQIWFLRRQWRKGEPPGEDETEALGIFDPEDIQAGELEPYFSAFLTDRLKPKLKELAVGDTPSAQRARFYLDYLEIQEILKEPDLDKRAELLLPFFLFTEEEKRGPTQWEAELRLRGVGQSAMAKLVPVFQDPKYEAMRTTIISVWANGYQQAVPLLVDLLRKENEFWKKQTPAELRLWSDMRPGHSPTMAQIWSRNRITMALFTLKALGNPDSRAIIEETRRIWNGLYPHDPNINLGRECDEAIFGIEISESNRRLNPQK